MSYLTKPVVFHRKIPARFWYRWALIRVGWLVQRCLLSIICLLTEKKPADGAREYPPRLLEVRPVGVGWSHGTHTAELDPGEGTGGDLGTHRPGAAHAGHGGLVPLWL